MKTPAQLTEYLLSLPGFTEATTIKELKDGHLNHTYYAETNRGPVVVKMYGASIKNVPSAKLPEGRYETERNAYQLLKEIIGEKINPTTYHFDDAQKIIVMEYFDGKQRVDLISDSINPKAYLELGNLLAEIANKTYGREELLPTFNGTEFQELKYHHRYYLHVDNPDLFAIRDRLMKSFRKNRHALMHGDLRFNNMFFIDGRFHFIDYEGAYIADISLDIAYLLAGVLIYFYEYPQKSYGEMARNLWGGFINALQIDSDNKELEYTVVKHAGFTLLDMAKGEVIKEDYSFVKNRRQLEQLSEKVIVDESIRTIDALLSLSYLNSL